MAAWPQGWREPTDEIRKAVEAASAEFDVPVELLYGMIQRESSFVSNKQGYAHGGNSATFAKSWEKYKGQKIPNGKGKVWGDLFPTPETWRAYGLCMLLPYNIIGKQKGSPVSAGVDGMYNVTWNVRCAAQLLAELYKKTGSWDAALVRYNGSTKYQREVAANIDAISAAQRLA